ncbi:hypothetical protein K4S71_09680 [Staphylococcus epidermidis]|nr:hypothetical protein [Staphylococcus epidermidis]MCG1591633.1 hypothetical protein [Staphylococcus epidermidis]MCG2478624.1 hypothetical protein [Staphylococcus epidermidis]
MCDESNVLYVVYSKGNSDDIKGIYDIEEINMFFDEFIYELVKEINENYSIEEQLSYHLKYIGKLTDFYDKYPCQLNMEENQSLEKFIKIYNEIAPEKLEYKEIEVSENEDMIIRYIFDYGLDKGLRTYKDKYEKLISIIIFHNESVDLTSKLKMSELNVKLKKLLIDEMNYINSNYDSDEILDYKHSYISKLSKCYYKLDNAENILEVFKEFVNIFNFEYEFRDRKIEFELLA